MEEQVQLFYNKNAESFSETRKNIWKSVKRILSSFCKFDLVLEIGCGNGKNLNYLLNTLGVDAIGFDFSLGLLQCCDNQNERVLLDLRKMDTTFRDGIFDTIISIAVFHHILTFDVQLMCIDITRKKIQKDGVVWISYWCPKGYQTGVQEIYWRNNDTRFYYVLNQNEIGILVNKSINSFYERENYYFCFDSIYN